MSKPTAYDLNPGKRDRLIEPGKPSTATSAVLIYSLKTTTG